MSACVHVCMPMCFCALCVCEFLRKQVKGTRIPGVRAPPHECWELNSRPLGKHGLKVAHSLSATDCLVSGPPCKLLKPV